MRWSGTGSQSSRWTLVTLALREALYGLDCIARVIDPASTEDSPPAAMEALMLKDTGNWRKYYQGDADRLQRRFSFSDRIRYYWPHSEAQAAVDRLFAKLGDKVIPKPLISQYLGGLYPEVVDGSLSARPRVLVVGAVLQVLRRYDQARGHSDTTLHNSPELASEADFALAFGMAALDGLQSSRGDP